MIAEVPSPSYGGPTKHTSDSSMESVPIEYTQQTVTALSSTKAEFSTAVAATKVVNNFHSILNVLLIPSSGPTVIYVDNDLCITLFNRSISF